MSQQRRRLPGDENPRPDSDAPMRVVRESELASGQGGYGIGNRTITRGVVALLAWRRRRKHRRPS